LRKIVMRFCRMIGKPRLYYNYMENRAKTALGRPRQRALPPCILCDKKVIAVCNPRSPRAAQGKKVGITTRIRAQTTAAARQKTAVTGVRLVKLYKIEKRKKKNPSNRRFE